MSDSIVRSRILSRAAYGARSSGNCNFTADGTRARGRTRARARTQVVARHRSPALTLLAIGELEQVEVGERHRDVACLAADPAGVALLAVAAAAARDVEGDRHDVALLHMQHVATRLQHLARDLLSDGRERWGVRASVVARSVIAGRGGGRGSRRLRSTLLTWPRTRPAGAVVRPRTMCLRATTCEPSPTLAAPTRGLV